MHSKDYTQKDFSQIAKDRKDLTDLSDRIHDWKNSLEMKRSIENKIALKEDLLKADTKSSFFRKAQDVFFPVYSKVQSLKRSIMHGEVKMEILVLEKQMNIYHRNALSAESFFDEIFELVEANYEKLVSTLNYYRCFFSKKDFPEAPLPDVMVLLNQYKNDPAISKPDKISFYLSMESTIIRCKQAIS